MKQAKASVREATTLLRWLQARESAGDNPPPYARVVHGYLLLLEACCDPAKDFLDWKPGTSPREIEALRAALGSIATAPTFDVNTQTLVGLARATLKRIPSP